MESHVTVGTLIPLPVPLTDLDGTLTDPTTLVFLVERSSPAGAIQTYTFGVDAAVVRDGVGLYHLEYLVESSGTYIWRAVATGTVQRAVEGSFTGDTYFDDPPVPVPAAEMYLTGLVSGDGSVAISTPAPGVRDLRARSGTGDKHYVHVQGTPATLWIIAHNLQKHPAITVADSAGTLYWAGVEYPDLNTALVRTTTAFSGVAYCN